MLQTFCIYEDSKERIDDLYYVMLGVNQELAAVFPGVNFRIEFVRRGHHSATVRAPPQIHSFLHEVLDQFENPHNQIEDREVAFAVAACKSRENHCLLEYARNRPLTREEILALPSRESLLHEFYPPINIEEIDRYFKSQPRLRPRRY